MNTTQDQAMDVMPTHPVAQFPPPSPCALRHLIAELNRSQDELKERVRQQEQITRNAVGVGILSVVLTMASIGMTVCLRKTPLLSNTPLITINSSNPPTAVLGEVESGSVHSRLTQ
jgi:hypothetical protein